MALPSSYPCFSDPPLLRLLAAPDPGHTGQEAASRPLGERLGRWLTLNDTIALSGLLTGPGAPWRPGTTDCNPETLPATVVRVRETLETSILGDAILAGSAARRSNRGTAGQAEPIDLAPYRRAYSAQQRGIDAALGPLRAHVRRVAAAQSAKLAELATLDETLERTLTERERLAFGAVPSLLERRFAAQRDDPWERWLPAFQHELQQALLAELELRVQPVLGLIDALNESRKSQ